MALSASSPSFSNPSTTKRIKKELANALKNVPPNISIGYKDMDISIWDILLKGPDNTPYKNGYFAIQLKFPGDYPFKPPVIKFSTKIYHPNVDDDGSICMALLKSEVWKPATTVLDILKELELLLVNPNPDDPLRAAIAEKFKSNRKEFEKEALEWTKKYAQKN